MIILILTQARALPATVLSRCQIVRFLPATPEGALALLHDGRDEGRRRALELLTKAEAEGGAGLRQVLDVSIDGQRVLRAVVSRRARVQRD